MFVFGAGWFAIEVAGWATEAGFEVAGLVELMDRSRVGIRHGGYRVVDAADLPSCAAAVVAGGGDRREHWSLAEQQGCVAATVVHPSSHVSSTATIGAGAIVGPGAIVGAGTTVEPHALLSRGALVGHHVTIGEFVRLMPGANVAGHVRLGAGTTVGMSAAVVDHVSIGEGVVVAAGAVVLRDVPDRIRVQGVPARVFTG